MNYGDLFVGAVAALLGLSLTLAAATNANWCLNLRLVRLVAGRWNRTSARIFAACLGLLLMALGVAIACKYSPAVPW